MTRSRRMFLKLLAAGSAAIAARPAGTFAAGRIRPPRARRLPIVEVAPPAAIRAGIGRQQRDLEKTLRTIRDYPLEPGSDPAFRFAPLRARRGGKRP